MLKVWGRANSINVQKVLWALDELGVPFQRVDAGMQYGGVDEPWYRAMNPNGRVPTIDDGGFVLWESNAVVRYLARKHGTGTLAPVDAATHASADRWMDWSTSTMAPPMTTLFWGYIRTSPERRDARALDDARIRMEAVMAMLDTTLSRTPYVAGEHLSMGDIPAGCFAHRWFALPIRRGDHPHVSAWYARLCARPGFRKHVTPPMT